MRKAGNNYQNLRGPITVGSPTGGFESDGSINAQALFVNGVSVTGGAAVASVTGTANQITASPTTGAVVIGLPQNVVIPTPVSGNALVATGVAAADTVSFTSVGSANALDLNSTTTTNRAALQIGQAGGGSVVIALDGTQQVLPGTTNGDFCIRNPQTIRFSANGYVASQLTITTAGNVTIAAPSSGQALTVTGIAGSSAAQFLTTGVQIGAPTGGDQGSGTINVAGNYFVNGVAVGTGSTILKVVALTTQSVTSSTAYVADTSLTLALTTGKYYQVYVQAPFKNASGVTGGGANFAFTYSGTGGILWGDDLSSSSTIGQPQVQGVSPTTANSFQNIAPNAFDSGGNMWVFFGTMFAGSVGGNLVVNWAQNTSNATATIRQIGAIMTAIQLN